MGEAQRGENGVAGRSARREAQHWRELREREAPGGFARFVSAIRGPSKTEKQRIAAEKRWDSGGRGEERVAQSLARRCPDVLVLHDRHMPRSRANIDHLAVCASGVYVIDAKRYRGKIEVRKPLFGQPKLRIAGRDKTKLVEGLRKQVAAVQAIVSDVAPDVEVHGCFCFAAPDGILSDVELPLLRTLQFDGYPLYYPRKLAKRLNSRGAITPERARALGSELAERFPPA